MMYDPTMRAIVNTIIAFGKYLRRDRHR